MPQQRRLPIATSCCKFWLYHCELTYVRPQFGLADAPVIKRSSSGGKMRHNRSATRIVNTAPLVGTRSIAITIGITAIGSGVSGATSIGRARPDEKPRPGGGLFS